MKKKEKLLISTAQRNCKKSKIIDSIINIRKKGENYNFFFSRCSGSTEQLRQLQPGTKNKTQQRIKCL